MSTYGYVASNPLAYIDALGLADPVGTILCDGKGGFKIIDSDQTSTRVCTQQHEQSHVDDFKKWHLIFVKVHRRTMLLEPIWTECQDSPILLCLVIRCSGVSAPPTESHFSVIRSAQLPMHS
jgi:hypothetical protein